MQERHTHTRTFFEMKLLTAPKYLSNAIAPLMTLNYLLGLRIFKYSRGKCAMPSVIYLLLLFGIYCVSTHVEYKFYKQINLLKLEYVLYEIGIYVNAFIVTYELIFGYFYTKTINACYRKIAQIDETLRQLGSMFNYGEIYFLSIGAVILWFTYVLCLVIIMTVQTRTDLPTMFWILVAEIYTLSISYGIIFEFSIFVRYLQTRFQLVNELLSEGVVVSTREKKFSFFTMEDYAKIIDAEQHQNILSTKVLSQLNRQLQLRIRTSVSGKRNLVRSHIRSHLPFKLQKRLQMEFQSQPRNQIRDLNSIRRSIMIAECRRRIHLLQTIRQVHLELCRVSKTLCTSFGVQITSEIGFSITYITVSLYVLFIQLVQRRPKATGYSLLDQVFVVIILATTFMMKIILINHVCKHATNEKKKTSEIIHEIYGCYPDADIREEIQQFGLQILQSPVEFFTFGVSLNYQLLSSCLKTVTTYLVIMIQMSISLESSRNS